MENPPPEKNTMEQFAQSRKIDALLAQYAESHQHPTNELIHFVCVPVIVFTLLGMLWSLNPLIALIVAEAAVWYYVRLSRPFALGMFVMSALMLGVLLTMPPLTVLPVSIALFVVAWIGQFIARSRPSSRTCASC
jgi:uncharacterized membrane protein YGL010W